MSKWRPAEVCREEICALLKSAQQLTSGLDDEEIEKLGDIAVLEECDINCLLTREDERSRDLFIVAKGALSVEVHLSPKDTCTVSILKIRQGGVAGELAFLDGGRRSASLRTIMSTTIIRLPQEELEALFDANKGMGFTIMRNLAQLVTHRLRSTNFELRSRLP